MPVTATLQRVNTALARFVHTEAFVAAARNEGKKNKQTGFQTVQHSKKISIHEVHMYMIG